MIEIHCYNCGGFIGDPQRVSHRLPVLAASSVSAAIPHSGLCTCATPVIYGPPAGHASTPGIRAPA